MAALSLKNPARSLRSGLSLTAFAALWTLAGCSGLDRAPSKGPPPEQTYETERETAWEALVQVFKPYPQKTVDAEGGLIETERLRGRHLFRPPPAVPEQTSGRFFYTLKATLREEEDEPEIVRAQIRKTVSKQKDFFSDPESLPSDGFEEEALLYRLSREIQIRRLLDKIYKEEEEESKAR